MKEQNEIQITRDDEVTFNIHESLLEQPTSVLCFTSTVYNTETDAFKSTCNNSINTSVHMSKTILVNKNEIHSYGTKLIYELSLDALDDGFQPNIIYNIKSSVNTTLRATTTFTNEMDVTDVTIPVKNCMYSRNTLIFEFDNLENLEINLTYTLMYLCNHDSFKLLIESGYISMDKTNSHYVQCGMVKSRDRREFMLQKSYYHLSKLEYTTPPSKSEFVTKHCNDGVTTKTLTINI
jgi:hypothetical protein